MATLQKLRNQAGLLLAIVIFVALAAFILGDLLKSGSSMIRGKQLEIAKIDGESTEYPDFQIRFDQIAEVYKSNNQVNTLDEKAYQQILNQAWENLVQEKIMTTVYNDLGIEITSDEMFDMVQGNHLHPIIQQVFGNPQTGVVDKAQVIQFLKYIQENPNAPQKASWLNIEKEILKAKKTSKYNDLVGKALYANSLQAQQSLLAKDKIASLQFIQKKLVDVPDSLVTFTESDLKKYYDAHLTDYEQKAQKTISYVLFNIIPSNDDDQTTLRWMNDTKVDFVKAEDNVQFVNMNADTRFEDVFEKQDGLGVQVADWAFNAAINDIYGPYKDGNVYKLAKLNAISMLPDSVKASHILIKATDAASAQIASSTIDSLKNIIESGKATFEQVAKDNSQDGSAVSGGDLGWFKRGQMVAPFEKAAFRAEKNELVVVQTQFGFHLIKVTVQGAKSKHVQLAVVDREVIPSTQTYQDVYTSASKFAANSQNLEGFNKEVEAEGLSPRVATISETDRQIPGLGAARPLIRVAFNDTEVGELVLGADNSPVFELDDKFVVAVLTSEVEEGEKSFVSVKSTIELAVIKEKKKEYLAKEFANASGTTLNEKAASLGLQLETASGFNFSYGSVNAIGYEPVINGAATALKVGEISKPIEGRNGVYLIELTSIEGGNNEDIAAEKVALYQSASYRANYQAYQTLKDKTEIEDKRSKFY
ncbi:MAG: SurA N-terminal domain-containing protein [Prolixibacteraceae bacterium]